VCNILVQQNTIQHLRVLNLSSRDLLDSRISLNVDFHLSVSNFPRHSADSGESEVAHKFGPAGNKLGADRRRYELVHGFVVVKIYGDRDILDDLKGVGQGSLEGGDDDNGVDVAFKMGK
jgi:hypothetical protein